MSPPGGDSAEGDGVFKTTATFGTTHETKGDILSTSKRLQTILGVRRYSRRPGGAALAALLVASLGALLPNAAWANDFGPVGVNLEQINVTPDGYQEPLHLEGRDYSVAGKNFMPTLPVEIFQCALADSDNLRRDCQPLGVAPVLPGGTFQSTVYMRQSFSSVNNGGINPDVIIDALFGTEIGATLCRGGQGVQCVVAAAQFAGVDEVRRAEHYICFVGLFHTCDSQPTARWW